MPFAVCPECEAEITLGPSPVLGQQLTCTQCDTDLEVVCLSPLELDWALIDSDEDWTQEDLSDDEEWEDAEDEWDEADEEEDWEDKDGDEL